MATTTAHRDGRRTDPHDREDAAVAPRRARGILGACIAAIVLVLVTAVLTAIVVDAVHGRPNPIAQATGQDDRQAAIDQARAAGYADGVRDTKQQAKDQLSARYDQGFNQGYAKGRSDTETNQGEAGGYAEGYNAGVKAAIDAYKRVIAQAQAVIAQAGQEPVATVTEPPSTTG